MNLRKFQGKLFADDNDESRDLEFVANLKDEAEFIENLRYWQIGIDKFNQIYLVSLDSDYQVSFLDFLRLNSIFQIYRWATPECFYELTGLVLCLETIQKKYILHKQCPDKISLISELPQDLLEGLLKVHTNLTKSR
ncbi:hypothetical protein [Nostoc sp. FACHB-110]|uniref:hypothetical protein n=1 Tax=Nostoc sp. FACHB-110 TaxID=2692834 RepID=UPI001687A2C6|nr:hypothetical protein [Nostoc sp. FACHB-110]MBD2435419.1 hypothetical protein [Nostoc sp. FACHB-110]